jgi:ribosome-binding protein aMBF1 (putative translation factor)
MSELYKGNALDFSKEQLAQIINKSTEVIEGIEKELEKEKEKVQTLKTIIKGLLDRKPVESPIYTLTPSFQQMAVLGAVEHIDDPETFLAIKEKLEKHSNFKEKE